jgi:hypothetical protein
LRGEASLLASDAYGLDMGALQLDFVPVAAVMTVGLVAIVLLRLVEAHARDYVKKKTARALKRTRA